MRDKELVCATAAVVPTVHEHDLASVLLNYLSPEIVVILLTPFGHIG
jgi:hypothetical protein